MNMRDKALELWEHLAMTGEPSKTDAYRNLGFKLDENGCPLCELALAKAAERYEADLNCEDCLLYNKWHGKNRTDHQSCMSSDTLNGGTYVERWYQAETNASRQIYANAIHYNIFKEWKTDSDEHEG